MVIALSMHMKREAPRVGEVAALDFDQGVTRSSQLCVLYFMSCGCASCQAATPHLHEIARRVAGRIRILSVDIDREGELAERFGVECVPTLVLFRDGRQVGRCTGAARVARFTAILETVLREVGDDA